MLRNDSAFLDAVGADSIPDPTTAGDFCRRFSQQDIDALMTAINEVSSVPPEDIVFGCNDRCDQENLIAQLSGGCAFAMCASGQSAEQLGVHVNDKRGMQGKRFIA